MRTSGSKRASWASVVACVLVWSCAGPDHVRRGAELLGKGQVDDAIEAYEEALRVEPDNAEARSGLREARRAAVQRVLERAKKRLANGDYPNALELALMARRMPLDLEEIDIRREVDDTVRLASTKAEAKVKELVDKGQFVPAVELSGKLAKASPGETARMEWSEQIRAQAVAHYSSQASNLSAQGLPGSAALQWAMARRVGAEVSAQTVVSLWDRFAEPICFARPDIVIADRTGKSDVVKPVLSRAVAQVLDGVRDRCGEGTRSLAVQVEVADAAWVDREETVNAARPLPGSGVVTVEEYVEKVPYTAVEEVTEYETRIEKQERRDCAPRPGQPRGCRTWYEDVEVKVPVVKQREVVRMKEVKRTRPKKGPFPADKVVVYPLTEVERQIRLEGGVRIGSGDPLPFSTDVRSRDTGHPPVSHPKLVLEQDPLEVKSMEDLSAEASDAVAKVVDRALGDAIRGWTRDDSERARAAVLAGKLPQAEEAYLGLLALGASDDASLARFFSERYGKPLADVMVMLAEAMGQSVEAGRTPGSREARFPRRGRATASAAPPPKPAEGDRPAEPVADPGAPDVSAMPDEELKALEAASFDEGREGGSMEERPPEGRDGDGEAAEPSEAQPEEEGGEEANSPS